MEDDNGDIGYGDGDTKDGYGDEEIDLQHDNDDIGYGGLNKKI